MADPSVDEFRFVWWNVGGLAHYDPERAGEDRWPRSADALQLQMQRVSAVLKEISRPNPPTLIALCEVTRDAAVALRNQLWPDHQVYSLDLLEQSVHHVAIIFPRGPSFSKPNRITVDDGPRGTRAMAFVDFICPGHRLRIFACHWTARFHEKSQTIREESASALNHAIYDFLHDGRTQGVQRHAMVLGDLNEEPFDRVMELRCHAYQRSRPFKAARTFRRPTYSPCEAVQLHLAMSWRKARTCSANRQLETAGTYYWAAERTWHTFDQVLITGSLLGDGLPVLDEATIEVHDVAATIIWRGSTESLLYRWSQVDRSLGSFTIERKNLVSERLSNANIRGGPVHQRLWDEPAVQAGE